MSTFKEQLVDYDELKKIQEALGSALHIFNNTGPTWQSIRTNVNSIPSEGLVRAAEEDVKEAYELLERRLKNG